MSRKNIQVHKFGGASVSSADAVKHMATIVKNFNTNVVIVVSAMGKTTNALERLVNAYFNQDPSVEAILEEVKKYHLSIIEPLFGDAAIFNSEFDSLRKLIEEEHSLDYNFEYDRIVSFGELLSTKIVARYLQQTIPSLQWIDIRHCLKTDNIYREASVDWELSNTLVNKTFHFKDTQFYLTQGFLGSTIHNNTTTLGREGSDYTAAALAYLLEADAVSVWKDVPGIMNADPKWLPEAVSLRSLSYSETVELTYYGAKVIHPKTLRPLQLKNIPLFVRSFVDPTHPGTQIGKHGEDQGIPFYIRKENQILVTLHPQDFSFIAYENFQTIHEIFYKFRLKINLIQMSALSYSVCFDNKPEVWLSLRNTLSKSFQLKYNDNVELITIRHYTPDSIDKVISNAKVYLEQRTRVTAQFVVGPKS